MINFHDGMMQLLSLLGSSGNLMVAIVVIIFTTIIIFILVARSQSGDTLLLLGLCNSGKTLMFSLLTANKSIQTQMSIKDNRGMYNSKKNGKLWKVVDLPGHEKVREKFVYKNKDAGRGVIFVVDSVNFPRETRDVAEFMYDVLANRTLQKNKVAILIACNKQDIATAKSCEVIQSQLEREINTLRKTRSAVLLGVGDYSSSKNAFIGKPGKDFEFSHVYPVKVEFCECNLIGETVNYEPIKQWLSRL